MCMLSFCNRFGADREPQSFVAYLQAELYPEAVYPTADIIFRQTERDRV